jgi:hypothetical protein
VCAAALGAPRDSSALIRTRRLRLQCRYVVEIALTAIERRDDRERMMRGDAVGADGNIAEGRHVHVRHQQAE